MQQVIQLFREKFLTVETFIYGSYNMNHQYWGEKYARERIEFARANPWVLSYDFGHKELMQAQREKII